MNQFNVLLNSTDSFLLFSINQSLNRTSSSSSLSSSSISRNTLMRYFQVIYYSVLVILGVFGNIICAIVFSTKSLRRIRSSAYLFTLALIDVFFILAILPGTIHTAFDSDLYRKLRFICYIQTYMSFVASFVHIWMVLAFTAERFFAVNFPLKHMSQCTPNLSLIVILIIIIPTFIFYIHPAFFVPEVDTVGQCREKDGHKRYLHNLNMIDTIMTMFLPFILVSILNILIIRKLFCSKAFRQHAFANGSRYQCQRISDGKKKGVSAPLKHSSMSSPLQHSSLSLPEIPLLSQSNSLLSHRSQRMIRPTRSTGTQRTSYLYRISSGCESLNRNLNNNDHNDNSSINARISSLKLKSKTISLPKRHDSAHRHVLTELRLTKMLLAISLTCLSLNFPSYYLRFIILYDQSTPSSSQSSDKNNLNETDFALYRGVLFHCMSYLSYSINIFIYLLFGGNFRRALKRLFSFKSAHSENFTTTINRTATLNHEIHKGSNAEYNSMTTASLQRSLRGNTTPFKAREHSSLPHRLHKKNSIPMS
ncbi:unnamed protein product [Rotaria magnacalcarata]|uniref:G-protein coupled receptors family 1 profile domain-containing protein n=1 Tax=Rotaria magnacalcarata TaxID=392030 RepID=A0A814Z743_9BILA|nr:unnamed protein product [Rotaria magnacalcarata]CAF1482511.1 unnamed protein product [Rotaria magnacalcarata]CAF2038347.1 unnamed protein product [Rotaria magnacalcarata]CAF2072213.1 unnamed protein product [Rotaria magnacalcarata]CAF3737151.1 unnamed protein product [Rotaria magnacalcarata]